MTTTAFVEAAAKSHKLWGGRFKGGTAPQFDALNNSIGVDVRLWPKQYVWDFGDNHGTEIACGGQGDCGGALGTPFVDLTHPSPIQHPYVWSSLRVNGVADAYTVKLGITFAADYRVSVNGRDQGGWGNLQDRQLTWTASHQVQEAQAVLTRACPVSVDHC